MITTPEHSSKTPSLYEWVGQGKWGVLFDKFYDKVMQDSILLPVFQHMSPEHKKRVTAFVIEVFGGPKAYSQAGGSHLKMVKQHIGRLLNFAQRKRWVDLLIETADEIGMPEDPEFRSSFVAYLEWGSRIALITSNSDGTMMSEYEPMPQWGWGETGGPNMVKQGNL